MSQPVERTIVNKLSYIALGANATSSFGGPLLTIKEAIRRLSDESLTISKLSKFYATPAFPEGAGPDFVNAVLEVESEMSAVSLLARLHAIENDLGRRRTTRWGARVIDLDLIAHHDEIIPDITGFLSWKNLPLEAQKTRAPDNLILPHPRLQDRAFVLGPFCDIAPDWVHPVLGQTVRRMFDALDEADKAGLEPLSSS